jgi:hypothetical protein
MSVQVDETSDVSTKEQVSMIAHLDKGSEIVERQLGFVDVSSNRNAAAITQVIKDKLSQHSGIKDKLIMQTYDGATSYPGYFLLYSVHSYFLLYPVLDQTVLSGHMSPRIWEVTINFY